MSTTEAIVTPESFRATFGGTGGDIFSLGGLKMLLWYVSIVGIPVGWLYTYRWMFRKIVLPTGTKVSFTGTVGKAYGFFALFAILSALKRYDPTAAEFFTAEPILFWTVALAWTFGLLAGQGLVYRELYKWTCSNVSLSSGTHLKFNGRPWPYIWWTIFSILSIFTIIGWAWVQAAFLRWQMRNTTSARYRLAFRGSGFAILWRTLLAIAGSLLILPIPWVVAWVYRWVIANIEAEPFADTV
jgi:hypothetical protein